MKQGSFLLFWNSNDQSKELIASISGSPVEFYDREAFSYLVRGSHPLVRNESHRSFYFSEVSDVPLSTKTIAGKWINRSSLILEACSTNWKKWNYQGEEVKTAKVYRTEREAKAPGTVIAHQNYGEGEIIVSTLDLFVLSSLAGKRVSTLLRNLGAPVKGKLKKNPRALSRRWDLKNSLIFTAHSPDTCESGVFIQIIIQMLQQRFFEKTEDIRI